MNLLQSFQEALESITANKMRSGLTMLGIIIGVAAVIAMLAIGNGAQESIIGEIGGLGTNLVYVVPKNGDVTNPKPLTLDDMEAINDPSLVPSIAAVSAAISGGAEVTFAGESTNTSVVGITPEYSTVQNLGIAEGESVTTDYLNGVSSVVVLGTDVAEELFGRKSGLVDETVRINGQPFRVIGVLEEQGGNGMGSGDDQVLIPLTTAQVRILPRPQRNQVDTIYASAVSAESVTSAVDEIEELLRDRHNVLIGGEDFSILTQQEFLDIASTITGILTIFLGGIAGISLLVGGIGIMNIMLVSVVERTREIGLRKAMGARKIDILSQFLVESVVISVIGGLIGIGLGWTLSALVGMIAASSDLALIPVMGVDSVLLATLFSTSVGIFFGIYPANRAASLEPVEALRSE